MLIKKWQGNYGTAISQLEFKNVDKEVLPWLENIAIENGCRIEKKEWKSKYNSYVVYDYEPFCSDGFEINLMISCLDENHLNFMNYLYESKLRNIEHLQRCYNF
jgi:hypothetical protein